MNGWIVGVDAGGTTSRALARHSGTGETRTAQSEGANWTVHGASLCRERLSALVRDMLPTGDAPSSLALCLAGYYPPDHREEVSTWAAFTWPSSPVRIEPDYAAAWAGAFGGKPGIIVIAGTGSIAYGRSAAGEEARAGGWGPLFGDEGSAYWLGRKTLAFLAEEDDTGQPESDFFLRLKRRWPELGDTRRAWLRGVYRLGWGREEIAGLAAALTDAEPLDLRATGVLYVAGHELANLTWTVHARLGFLPMPAALLGGIGERSESVRKGFADGLPSELELVAPESGPVEGALLLAAEQVS